MIETSKNIENTQQERTCKWLMHQMNQNSTVSCQLKNRTQVSIGTNLALFFFFFFGTGTLISVAANGSLMNSRQDMHSQVRFRRLLFYLRKAERSQVD